MTRLPLRLRLTLRELLRGLLGLLTRLLGLLQLLGRRVRGLLRLGRRGLLLRGLRGRHRRRIRLRGTASLVRRRGLGLRRHTLGVMEILRLGGGALLGGVVPRLAGGGSLLRLLCLMGVCLRLSLLRLLLLLMQGEEMLLLDALRLSMWHLLKLHLHVHRSHPLVRLHAGNLRGGQPRGAIWQ